jgi:hypothetical protein
MQVRRDSARGREKLQVLLQQCRTTWEFDAAFYGALPFSAASMILVKPGPYLTPLLRDEHIGLENITAGLDSRC